MKILPSVLRSLQFHLIAHPLPQKPAPKFYIFFSNKISSFCSYEGGKNPSLKSVNWAVEWEALSMEGSSCIAYFPLGVDFWRKEGGREKGLDPRGCGVRSCHGYMAAVCSSLGPSLVQSYIHAISSSIL